MKASLAAKSGRISIPKVDIWTAALVLLAVVVGGYYIVLGFRYWSASHTLARVNAQEEKLTSKTRQTPQEAALSEQLAAKQQQLQDITAQLSSGGTDGLVGVISSAAAGTKVELISVAVGEPQTKTVGGITYQAQPMSVRMQGPSADIYTFLERIQENANSVSIAEYRAAGLEGAADAQVQLVFYLSPQAATDKKAVK